ncbi:MAG TPA: TonB family protein [Vicinamibacterales bacterium]|nr:TonB family protein [Vicinamibacterales bacterium]
MKACVTTLTLVVSLLAPVAALAQDARVVGTVIDASGALLPGATVTADRVDPTERNTTTVKTDRTGHFEFADLRAGSYALMASLPGFETFRAAMSLEVGDYRERNIQLQIGSLQETVTVTPTDPPDPPRAPTATPAPSAPPRELPPGAVRIGGNIKPPVQVARVRPVYPAAEAAQGIGGTVVLSATIGTDGLVRDAKALRNPNDELSRAAIDAVSQWQFTPTLLDGSPTAVRMRVAVTFRK